MTRVTGIGGVFFKARGDRAALLDWYRKHLGIDAQDWGAVFQWHAPGAPELDGATAWNIFAPGATKFGPDQAFMVNYRVRDLEALLRELRAEGCDVDPKVESGDYGKFGWVTDPEGNRIELWEPPAS